MGYQIHQTHAKGVHCSASPSQPSRHTHVFDEAVVILQIHVVVFGRECGQGKVLGFFLTQCLPQGPEPVVGFEPALGVVPHSLPRHEECCYRRVAFTCPTACMAGGGEVYTEIHYHCMCSGTSEEERFIQKYTIIACAAEPPLQKVSSRSLYYLTILTEFVAYRISHHNKQL